LGKEFSCATDEWFALDIFIVARAFADEHQFCFGISYAEYELGARFMQAAARAFAEVGANVVKRFADYAFGGFEEGRAGGGRDYW
jgi:hypothetical protein